MEEKVCNKCSKILTVEMFYKNKETKDKLLNICKLCIKDYNRKRYISNGVTIRNRSNKNRREEYKRNPDKFKNNSLKRKFNLSLDDYNKILESQNGVCAICKKQETQIMNGKVRSLAVDHDHKTNKIRGLLCYFCNTSLGKFHDDINILKNAIVYLTKEGSK